MFLKCCCEFQLLKNTKTLRSDKAIEQNANKVTQLENELKEALAKIKEFESNKDKDEKTEKKVRFGGELTKKDSDTLKAKQDELDKLKLNFSKVSKSTLNLEIFIIIGYLSILLNNFYSSWKKKTQNCRLH